MENRFCCRPVASHFVLRGALNGFWIVFLMDLIEHSTQSQFVYQHEWRPDDFVIWDNRATMHRGMVFQDETEEREMRRVTTLDD